MPWVADIPWVTQALTRARLNFRWLRRNSSTVDRFYHRAFPLSGPLLLRFALSHSRLLPMRGRHSNQWIDLLRELITQHNG